MVSISIQGLIFLILFAIVAFSDIIPLVKKRQTKDIWTYLIIGIVSTIMLFLFEAGIKLPSPSKVIEKIVLGVLGK